MKPPLGPLTDASACVSTVSTVIPPLEPLKDAITALSAVPTVLPPLGSLKDASSYTCTAPVLGPSKHNYVTYEPGFSQGVQGTNIPGVKFCINSLRNVSSRFSTQSKELITPKNALNVGNNGAVFGKELVDSQVEWTGAATPTIAHDSRNTASQHCVGEGSSQCITRFDDDN